MERTFKASSWSRTLRVSRVCIYPGLQHPGQRCEIHVNNPVAYLSVLTRTFFDAHSTAKLDASCFTAKVNRVCLGIGHRTVISDPLTSFRSIIMRLRLSSLIRFPVSRMCRSIPEEHSRSDPSGEIHTTFAYCQEDHAHLHSYWKSARSSPRRWVSFASQQILPYRMRHDN